jgi:hypothetical protein
MPLSPTANCRKGKKSLKPNNLQKAFGFNALHFREYIVFWAKCA